MLAGFNNQKFSLQCFAGIFSLLKNPLLISLNLAIKALY